jgi:peptide chain release factor 1
MSDDDLRVELISLDNRGGQKVGTGRFLLRVTHVPTGMAVTITDKRGQHKARDCAITMLSMMVEDFA